ncbi:hypothetical protein ANANG_G00182210 [Anguilla anguilla]|uniref:EF-hand domain-containing protein n=1 Tax=Anguilla anguilla TaxID=7936 RepID=A0A9D3MBZ2_ANGAN|nr:hypothetical protein ANANG_G00182210 [Anguilla anguilla]
MTHLRNILLQTDCPVSFSMEAPELTATETSLILLVGVFNQYASGDSDKKTLSKDEFGKLVKDEFPLIFQAKDAADIMKKLDKNKDNLIDINEFMHMISDLVGKSYKMMCDMEPKK